MNKGRIVVSSALTLPDTVWQVLDSLGATVEVAPVTASVENAVCLLAPAQLPLTSPQAMLVAWVDGTDGADGVPLRDDPRVAAVLDSACSVDTIFAALRAALTLCLEGQATHTLERILEVGRALSSEKDLDRLLDLVLSHAQALSHSDGASIYTRDPNGKLYFRLWKNQSAGDAGSAQKIPVDDESVAGYVARTGDMLVLDDAYQIPADAPYRFSPASDQQIGYCTRSMLTLPLKNKADEVVGVLQLINRKDHPTAVVRNADDCDWHVLSYDGPSQLVAQALAGQAGVALENSILYSDIEKLFEGFIHASVHAIEARDPTTAGHSFRVAEFTERLARAVDRSDVASLRRVQFDREALQELRYAALLHDFGKVGVREHVLVKANKLYPHELETVRQRFHLARSNLEREALRKIIALHDAGPMTDEEFRAQRQEIENILAEEGARLEHFLEVVLAANQPAVLHTTVSEDLGRVASYSFVDHAGQRIRLLDDFEFAGLALARGSLNSEEREEIESHVTHTFNFLSLIPWTKNLARLPDIAYGHHEKLDGTGYPRGLAAADIPVQTRMMTISDIYDALTAADRPYKKAMPVERALDILGSEAQAGKVDADLLGVFIESGACALIGEA